MINYYTTFGFIRTVKIMVSDQVYI